MELLFRPGGEYVCNGNHDKHFYKEQTLGYYNKYKQGELSFAVSNIFNGNQSQTDTAVEESKAEEGYSGNKVRYLPKCFVFAVKLVSVSDIKVGF